MHTSMIASLAGLALSASALAGPVLINEFQPNPAGTDPTTTTIELRGTAGASFRGFLINIDTDGPASGGAFAFVNPTGSFAISGVFDANGLLTVSVADFENPSFGFVLASNSLAAGTDLDANNDGLFDNVSAFGTIFDAIFVSDQVEDAALGAALVSQLGVGTNLAFSGLTGNSSEPLSVFRDGVTNAVYQVVVDGAGASSVFDAAGSQVTAPFFGGDPLITSFGAVNATIVPTPGAAALLGLGGLLASRRRR